MIFLQSPESAHQFHKYMSSRHQNIDFTVEQEIIGSLLLLDIKICHKNGKFVTSAYRKATFTGFFTSYKSFVPTYQMRGLLHTLLHRSFSICCDFKTFHFEISHLKTILKKNIDLHIKSFLNKLYAPKTIVQNVPKRNVFVTLLFLGSILFQIQIKLCLEIVQQ